MLRTQRQYTHQSTAEIIDFDEVMLSRCTPELRAELMTEAAMLAQAFAPEGGAGELEEMARVLSSGVRDAEMGRARARQLAAALCHLAKDPAGAWRLLGGAA